MIRVILILFLLISPANAKCKYYAEAERGIVEKETCDLGFDNYRCDEIKNGTVIIKEGNEREDENKADFEGSEE